MKLGVKTTKMAAAFMQQKIAFYVQPKDLLGEGKNMRKHTKLSMQMKEQWTTGENGEPTLTD
jgi:hypothetical protein